jgi:hypothetical protein
MNGMFLTAVLAHFIYWPKRWVGGITSRSMSRWPT